MKSITLIVGDENGLRGQDQLDGRKMRKASAPDPIFGSQVRSRRKALKITQEDFGQLVGVHPVTLSRIETGTAPVTERMRIRLDHFLTVLEEDQ